MATVKALKAHTHKGDAHDEGEEYDVEEQDVDSLFVQGMAAPLDLAAPAPKPSQPVEPLTTESFGRKKRT